MYYEYFNLKEHPFRLTCETKFFYLSPEHTHANAMMEFALIKRQGMMVLSGDAGTGKSMLVEHFISRIDQSYRVCQLHQTLLDEERFLDVLLSEMGEENPQTTVAGKVEQLNGLLEGIHSQSQHSIIIVDDAHNLDIEILLRLFEFSQRKVNNARICTIYLVGDGSLREKLDAQPIREYISAINAKYHLGALATEDIRKYIYHRLAVAGGHQSVKISKNVFPVIETYTGGKPSLINILMDHVLIYAYLEDVKEITSTVVDSAVADLHWVPYGVKKSGEKVDTEETFTEERRSSYKIVIQTKNKKKGEYFIRKKRINIGRHRENDLRIDDPRISRQHAQIIRQGRTTYLRDLNSTNGTYVDNRRVDIAPLKEGTVIKLGSYRLIYTRSTKNAPARSQSDLIQKIQSKNTS